ncbi:Hypothetical predicted protein [Paramuricea clavata]|uniref:Uncharacterized protein n=1 Tax=Paramuricea clavata TaxID=317549 RepID=A0A7D9IX01_PARCT|nr:Hypothetical predicted protein [Paramuricea clavata]
MATTSSAKLKLKPENTERKKESETPSSSKRKAESSTVTKPTDTPKVSSKEKPPVKKAKVAETPEGQKREIAINQILKDVIFVLSGFKNPERGNLRDKAVSMGARYRGDWDKTCTHLICAFMNTPKYSQVKATGKGKIVSQKWVHDCLSRKKRLPEKRYKLRGDDSDDDDSSTEEEIEIPAARKTDKDRPTTSHAEHIASPSRELTSPKTTSESTPAPVATTPDEINKTDDIEENSSLQDNTEIIEDEPSGSGHDTEDEIRRVVKDEEDPYNCSTECETDDDDGDGDGDDVIKKANHKLEDKTTLTKSPTVDLINLPDFFSKMTFFLYGEFDSEERRMLIRYITAYDGELEEYMSDTVKYVITNENWDDNFDEV